MQSVLRSAALISSAPSLVKAARTYTTASKFLHSRSLLCASSTSGSPRLEPKPFFPTEPAGQSFSSNGGSQASTPKHDKPSFASQNGHQSSENGATSQDMAHKKSDDFQGAMLDPSAANKNWVSSVNKSGSLDLGWPALASVLSTHASYVTMHGIMPLGRVQQQYTTAVPWQVAESTSNQWPSPGLGLATIAVHPIDVACVGHDALK